MISLRTDLVSFISFNENPSLIGSEEVSAVASRNSLMSCVILTDHFRTFLYILLFSKVTENFGINVIRHIVRLRA